MNELLPIPDSVPPDLYGRREHDRMVRFLDVIGAGRIRWAGLVHRRELSLGVDDRRLRLVVAERRTEAHDENVISVVFAAPGGDELPVWRPGAHLDVELPSGRLRQYSLCGDPADSRRYRIAVRRIPNGDGGSIEVHDDLTVGSAVTVRGPRNAFAFAVPGFGSRATQLHFVAGGIGITPILPMIRLAHRLSLDWSMVYTGRSRDSLPFLAELTEFGARVRIRTDDANGLPTPDDLLPTTAAGTAIYCCGPSPMTTMLLAAVRTRPGIEFHAERFSPPPIIDGVPFEVELARTGEVLTVPADRSTLDVVRERRPDVAFSCRQGFCRTCRVRVLAGTPDHRDTTLTPAEQHRGDMLICVSRARDDRLVLDI